MTDGHTRKVSKASHHVNSRETLDYGEKSWVDYDSTKRYPKSVWTFSKDTQRAAYHNTQKPLALIEEILKTYSNPGDVVLDSCAGSMTLAIAAIKTGRNYICFEKDNEIFDIGSQRVKNYLTLQNGA